MSAHAMNPSASERHTQEMARRRLGSAIMRFQLSCCLLALLAAAGVAHAQMMINPMLPPSPPASPAPANSLQPTGSIRAEAFLPTSVTFSWRTGQSYAFQPQPGPASSFITCLYDPAAGETCNNTPQRWVRAASALSRTALTNPLNPLIVVAYEYRLDIQSIPATRQDKNLAWRVLACASTVGTSCTDMSPVPLRLLTKNLRAENISTGGSESNRQRVSAKGEVRNTGTTNAAQFRVWVEVQEVFYDPVARTCRTDLGWPQLPADAEVITATGAKIEVSSLPRRPNGSIDTRGIEIRGIFRQSMQSDIEEFTTALGAGATWVSEPVAESPTLPHDPNSPTDRAAWAMLLMVDTMDAIKEFDELDNVRVECQTF